MGRRKIVKEDGERVGREKERKREKERDREIERERERDQERRRIIKKRS